MDCGKTEGLDGAELAQKKRKIGVRHFVMPAMKLERNGQQSVIAFMSVLHYNASSIM